MEPSKEAKKFIPVAYIRFKDENDPKIVPTSDIKIKEERKSKAIKKIRQQFRSNNKGQRTFLAKFQPLDLDDFKKEFWYFGRYQCPTTCEEEHKHEGFYKCNVLMLGCKSFVLYNT